MLAGGKLLGPERGAVVFTAEPQGEQRGNSTFVILANAHYCPG